MELFTSPKCFFLEATSVDVAGTESPSDGTIEDYHAAILSGIPLAADTTSSSSSLPSTSDRMVASMQSLDDLGVNHSASAGSNGDRQLQQERYGHAYRSTSQTTQDKRSRLSNVINNLRKKVPDRNAASPRKEEDNRNSVERNLETLEKYVMTVLNGVIKEDEAAEEEEEEEEEDKNTEGSEKRGEGTNNEEEDEEEEEDPTDTAVKSELSNESDIEAAVAPRLEDSIANLSVESRDAKNAEPSNITDRSSAASTMATDNANLSTSELGRDSKMKEERLDAEENESAPENNREASRERKTSRTLSTIIMDRLSEHQVEDRANIDDGRGGEGERVRDVRGERKTEVRAICGELLNDLLSNVHRAISDKEDRELGTEEKHESSEIVGTTKSTVDETKDSNAQVIPELSVTSLHCSLPLDKVASVLQSCQNTGESATALRLASDSSSGSASTQKLKSLSCTTPPIRLLCLYCDRKFASMSLRQRHTERVHQLGGGGRRSERNSRKISQSCQYCSEKCIDSLEALFRHMVSSHGDKYYACVQCSTRYPTREALIGHTGETHYGNTDRTSQNQVNVVEKLTSGVVMAIPVSCGFSKNRKFFFFAL